MIRRAATPNDRIIVVAYLASKIGVEPQNVVGAMPFEGLMVERDGKMIGAVVFLNKRSHTIDITWAGEPGWLSKGDLRDIWTYPFKQLGCLTVTGTTSVRNIKGLEMNRRMGCTLVGTVPHAFGKDHHGEMFVMEHDKCKWITETETEEADVRRYAKSA